MDIIEWMAELEDHDLLEEFVRNESEPAFATLVGRHASLVYSTALRFTANPHHAEEITQAVFVILARRAGRLSRRTVLSGWLYQAARLTAANFTRTELRRQRREQEAYMLSTFNETDDDAWRQIAPFLDEAMGALGETDRTALVLRYFENNTAVQVAVALGLSEAAAHKRVTRAVEKLRALFSKRGIALSTAAVAGAVSANSVSAAPAGMPAGLAATIVKGAPISTSTATLIHGTIKTMTWLKMKLAASLAAAVIIAAGATLIARSGESSPAKSEDKSQSMLIVPGESVGKVRKGMTTNEVEAVLGKPDKSMGQVMIYDRPFGMSVIQSANGATVIFGGDSLPTYPGVKKFKGRTKEGIGMESTRAEIIKAFGEPTKANPSADGREELEYSGLGLTFILDQGKVFHITVDFRKH